LTSPCDEVEKYQKKLDLLSPGRFRILELVAVTRYGKARNIQRRFRFRDVQTGAEFEYYWHKIQAELKKNPEKTFQTEDTRSDTEKYQEQLDDLAPRRFSVLQCFNKQPSPESRSRKYVRVQDSKYSTEFDYDIGALKQELRANPDSRFFVEEFCEKDFTSETQSKFDVLSPGRLRILGARRTGPPYKYEIDFIDTWSWRKWEGENPYTWIRGLTEDPEYSRQEAIELEGKTLPQIAEEHGYSRAHIHKLYKKWGDDFIDYLKPHAPYSPLEVLVQGWLDGEEVVLGKKLDGTNIFPDVYLPQHNLAVECDGLYWHCDRFRDRRYHFERRQTYESVGVRALFFREDELLEKPEICQGILQNALGRSRRVFARKTTLGSAPPSFFEKNHLMGKGSGRGYGLYHDGDLVAGMRVRWVSKSQRQLDVSRFCTKLGVSVVGGWSKLLKHVIGQEDPSSIRTFVDMRYGTGAYLEKMGWKLESCHASFNWTKGMESLHRLRYPGSSGYEAGYRKIWDCGQAKWVLQVN